MKKKTVAAVLAVGLVGAGLAFAEGERGNPAGAEAKALFEAKCSICHPLARPLGKTKDRAGWVTTVTRMQKSNGCPITDDEANTIIEYLAAVRGPAAAAK